MYRRCVQVCTRTNIDGIKMWRKNLHKFLLKLLEQVSVIMVAIWSLYTAAGLRIIDTPATQ